MRIPDNTVLMRPYYRTSPNIQSMGGLLGWGHENTNI